MSAGLSLTTVLLISSSPVSYLFSISTGFVSVYTGSDTLRMPVVSSSVTVNVTTLAAVSYVIPGAFVLGAVSFREKVYSPAVVMLLSRKLFSSFLFSVRVVGLTVIPFVPIF